MQIEKYIIRASYPNYFMVKLYVEQGRKIFEKANEREGNKPGTVIYHLEGDDKAYEIPPKWYDIYYLLTNSYEKGKTFLSFLIEEKNGDITHADELERLRLELYEDCKSYVAAHPLFDDRYIVTTLTENNFSEVVISNKGKMLLELTRQCYAVPDFCILTSNAFQEDNQELLLEKAVRNLEIMTKSRLGDDKNPLVFALRCAMPQYIPGLMPTLLNVGINRTAYRALVNKYGLNMGNRIYLCTLSNICDMLGLTIPQVDENHLTIDEQLARITLMESEISRQENSDRLLEDSFYQAFRLTLYVKSFFDKNQDLVLTFMRGRQAFPSLILHKMVWTIGNKKSFPGVLYSRHSRTGVGRQIESYPDIFGEEIMTGNISSVDDAYMERSTIRDNFPAVYHFDPLLQNLEKRFKSPVTIEFAVETTPDKSSLFAVLQLNRSELTGRAAMMSAIDMYEKKFINKENLIDLVRPYHLRQIFSDAIDETSFSSLTFFCKGINVLPRSATTARLCFSAAAAYEMKRQGFAVCLCKERFTPEDTIVLNEVDAIMSMTPAAIHVVTACRGYGIPAFLNLQIFGVKIKEDKLINDNGVVINEYEWITVSSKRQSIYIGEAKYTPARFRKYLNGQKIELSQEEKPVFDNLKTAYGKYQKLITDSKVNFISDIDSLARLISYDLNENPEKAREIVNTWYRLNPETYQDQVLESSMGSHQVQARVFDLLDIELQVDFFKNIIMKCKKQNLSGLQAGSFMIGRFLAKPLSKIFWEAFSPAEIAFMLNEYVLYEKYLTVLQEVGETKLTRAHSKIESSGLEEMEISNFDYYIFVPLMSLPINWEETATEVSRLNSTQNNTSFLVNKLSTPINKLFDIEKPWIRNKIEKLLAM